jgi:hypothetical protein
MWLVAWLFVRSGLFSVHIDWLVSRLFDFLYASGWFWLACRPSALVSTSECYMDVQAQNSWHLCWMTSQFDEDELSVSSTPSSWLHTISENIHMTDHTRCSWNLKLLLWYFQFFVFCVVPIVGEVYSYFSVSIQYSLLSFCTNNATIKASRAVLHS